MDSNECCQDYDYWIDIFSDPSKHGIISQIHNIYDIMSLRKMYPEYQDVIQNNITMIDSFDMVQIPLNMMYGYVRLERTHNVLFQVFNEKDARAVGTLVKLIAADFLFPSGREGIKLVNSFVKHMLTPVTLSIMGEEHKYNRELMEWENFTFGFLGSDTQFESTVAIGIEGAFIPYSIPSNSMAYLLLTGIGKQFVQSGQYLHIINLGAFNDKCPTEIPGLNIKFPNSNPCFTCGFQELHFFNNNMLSFISDADFGLVDPSQPPSSDNKALKECLPFVQLGISNIATLRSLLYIYVKYIKKLYYVNTFSSNKNESNIRFKFDPVMRKYFALLIRQENEKLSKYAKSVEMNDYNVDPDLVIEGPDDSNFIVKIMDDNDRPLILTDNLTYSDLRFIAESTVLKDPGDFSYQHLFRLREIRKLITHTDLSRFIDIDVINNTLQIYIDLQKSGGTYYLSDGTCSSF